MKKILSLFIALTLLAFVAIPVYAAYVPPSTNDNNRTKSWAHVDQVDVDIGKVTLNFIQPRNFKSCFEYRTDGDTSQYIDDVHPLETHGVVPEGDPLQEYRSYCLSTMSNQIETIEANGYVEIRMIFGAEGDERFDWTRFDVIPAITTPTVSGFINPSLPCGALTNIHSTTVDWSDSTGGVGGVVGYEYSVDYPLANGGVGHWTTFLAPSQRSGTLNEGLHVIKVRAKDNAGNYSSWSNECSITADWTAPTISWITPEDSNTYSGVIPLKAECNEVCDYVNFWWRAEGEIFSSASKRYHYVYDDGTIFEWGLDTMDALTADGTTYKMEDGTYYLYAAGKDMAGNWARTPGELMVLVNNTPDNMNQCKKDGWKTFFAPTFRNQGDCVSWIQSSPKAKGNRKDNN